MGCNVTVGVYTPGATPGDYGKIRDVDDEYPMGDLRGWEWWPILSGRTISSETKGENPWRPAFPHDDYGAFHYDMKVLRENVQRAFPEGHWRLERFLEIAEQAQCDVGADRAVISVYM